MLYVILEGDYPTCSGGNITLREHGTPDEYCVINIVNKMEEAT